ncbi:MAG: TlpA family protein disulfide reductase [Actinomycetota bacterium]
MRSSDPRWRRVPPPRTTWRWSAGPRRTPPIRLRRLGRALLATTAALAVSAGCTSSGNVRFSALSGPMPALSGPGVTGHRVDSSVYAGKMVLINFWASWCAPCRREQPGLEALWRRLGPTGAVAFVGVNHRDNASKANAWIERYGVTYPSISDPGGEIAARFGVPFLPATILVDRTGQLRYRLIGAQEPDFVEGLLDVVADLGAEPSPSP